MSVAALLGAPEVRAGNEGPREEARQIVLRHCGVCHIRGNPGAVEKALAVFDLTQADWSAKLSERQLAAAKQRLSKSFTGTERATFDAFVAGELKARASAK